MRIDGVGLALDALEVKGNSNLSTGGFDPRVDLLCPSRPAEFLFEVAATIDALRRHIWIQLKCKPARNRLVARVALRQRSFEPALANVAPRTNDI